MVLRIIATFMASLTFAVLFSAPRKELIYCGFSGAAGWLFFEILSTYYLNGLFPTFIAAMAATAVSRLFSFKRKQPITIYLIAGIIPFVPGAGIYYTMYHILMNDTASAVNYGVETVKTAGIISLGIVIIMSLPYQLFKLERKK